MTRKEIFSLKKNARDVKKVLEQGLGVTLAEAAGILEEIRRRDHHLQPVEVEGLDGHDDRHRKGNTADRNHRRQVFAGGGSR